MALVSLAWSGTGHETLLRWCADEGHEVRLLVAYPFLKQFEKKRSAYRIKSLMLDSGAFSAHNRGEVITVEEFTQAAKGTGADEVFGLDVIGDHEATQRNLSYQWDNEVEAIPTVHMGSPASAMDWCLEHAPGNGKIALGGIAKNTGQVSLDWMQWCLGRSWPRRLHVFGRVSWPVMRLGPWDSVDASSWLLRPAGFGVWDGYSDKKPDWVRARGVKDYRTQMRPFLLREKWSEAWWRNELKTIRTGSEVLA